MTQAVKKLVGDFDKLGDADREQVLAELLRRAVAGPHPLPTDRDLTALADQVFLDLDRREQNR